MVYFIFASKLWTIIITKKNWSNKGGTKEYILERESTIMTNYDYLVKLKKFVFCSIRLSGI